MSLELRANTAVDVLIGPHVDSTNGNTPEEGLTIEDEHVLLSKLGQALAAKTDANDAVHDDDGYYNCPLDTTDTNTEGTLVLTTHLSGALPVRHEYMILSEAAWDSKYVAKDNGFMDVNIKTIGRVDTQETEANNLESACSNYSVTRGLTGTAVPAAAADAATGLPISDAGGLDLDVQLANTNEVTAARMGALTDWINAGRLDLILDIIAADTTTNIPAILATIDALIDAIKAVTDLMADSASTLLSGTISWDNTNASTTVFYSDDITEATADHFNGRIVIFLDGALQYQATAITDYALDTGEGKFTVTAVTEAPADDTTFVIV